MHYDQLSVKIHLYLYLSMDGQTTKLTYLCLWKYLNSNSSVDPKIWSTQFLSETGTLPGTKKSPSLARRSETILAGGSDIGFDVLQWLDTRLCPQFGRSTCSQSTASISGNATLHSCRIINTNLGEGLKGQLDILHFYHNYVLIYIHKHVHVYCIWYYYYTFYFCILIKSLISFNIFKTLFYFLN